MKDKQNLSSHIIASIFQKIGIRGLYEIQKFLYPDIHCLSDPFLISQMKDSCHLIEDAVKSKKKIFLYGDGDVDGISGVAIFSNLFQILGVSFDIKLTHRCEDYEIEPDFLKRIKNLGYGLLITVDIGTSSEELINYCEKIGFPLIIVDHHRAQIHGQFKHVKIVNPSLGREDACFDILTASGLALKFVQSFRSLIPFFPEEIFLRCIELAMLGTLGDYGLLLGENRVIVRVGLECFENTSVPGLEKFKKYFYVPKKFQETGQNN